MSKTLSKSKKVKKYSSTSTELTSGPRVLKEPKRQLYRPSTWHKPKPVYAPIAKSRHILVNSIRSSWLSKKAVGGITLVYGAGIILLVRGLLSSQDFVTIKQLLDSIFTGTSGKIEGTLVQLSALFSTNGSINSTSGGLYQAILLILCSLAIIWVFRQAQTKKQVTTREAFYQGMYPLVPFLLVILVISIQAIPLIGASYLYKTLITNGVAVLWQEKLISYSVMSVLLIWSLRMLTSSVFALYIVTLPGMTPLRALRSAKNLVRSRKLLIWRKVLLLPTVLILGTTILVLPFLLFLTPTVVWVFFILSTFWFTIGHGYMYLLYRELIKDA